MELSGLSGKETCRMVYLPDVLTSQLCKWQEQTMKMSPPPRPSANDKEVKSKLKSEMITDVFARVMRVNKKSPRPPPGKWRKILEKPVFKHDMSGKDSMKQYRRLVTYRRQKRGEKIACTLRRLKKQQHKRNVVPSRYLQFPVFLESEAQMEATGPVVKYAEVKHKLIYEKRKKGRLNRVISSEEQANKEINVDQNENSKEHIRATSGPQFAAVKEKRLPKVGVKKLKENANKTQTASNKSELSKEAENKDSQQDLHAASDDKQLKKAHSKTLPHPQWHKWLSKRKPVQKDSPVGLLLQITRNPQSSKPLMISNTLQESTLITTSITIKKEAEIQSGFCKTPHVAPVNKRFKKRYTIQKQNVIDNFTKKNNQIKLIYPSSISMIPRENKRHISEVDTQSELVPQFYSVLHDFHINTSLTEDQTVKNILPKDLFTRENFHSRVSYVPPFVSKSLDSKDLILGSHSRDKETLILPPINVDKNNAILRASTTGDQRKYFQQNIFPDANVYTKEWQQKSHHTDRGTELSSCLSVFRINDVIRVKRNVSEIKIQRSNSSNL